MFHIAVKLKNLSEPPEQKAGGWFLPELGPTNNYVGDILKSSCQYFWGCLFPNVKNL